MYIFVKMKEVLSNSILKESQRPKTEINPNETVFYLVILSVFGYKGIVI